MDNGCFSSSPRHDAFPAGLRVLVVDDDLTWLRILEKMLKKCLYEGWFVRLLFWYCFVAQKKDFEIYTMTVALFNICSIIGFWFLNYLF